jgi:hypothetical protein
MFSRILLDNDDFLVTSGLLGGIKVTFKSRGITVKADRSEKIKLLNVLDELKQRGYSAAPESKEFERIISDFSEALLGRGGVRWQAYFAVSTCEDIVSEVVGGAGISTSENRKTSKSSWMDKVRQSLDVTPEEWQETINSRMAEEQDRYHKISEPKIMQIDHDFDWNEVYGFCIYREAPALQFRTKNDPYDKTTAYTLHGRYLKISEDGAYWEEIRTILPLIGRSMSKDEFIKFSDDYIG